MTVNRSNLKSGSVQFEPRNKKFNSINDTGASKN